MIENSTQAKKRNTDKNYCWTSEHKEMLQKGPQRLTLAWYESVYFGDGEKLFDLPGISTKAGITTIDATLASYL